MYNFRHYDHRFASSKEACVFYNVCPATLHRWAKAGRIRYRVGLGGKNREYELVEPEEKRGEDNACASPEGLRDA
jgi:predicted site-specific integrase-resolvase